MFVRYFWRVSNVFVPDVNRNIFKSRHLILRFPQLWAMGAAVTAMGAGAAPTVIIGASNVALDCMWGMIDHDWLKMAPDDRSIWWHLDMDGSGTMFTSDFDQIFKRSWIVWGVIYFLGALQLVHPLVLPPWVLRQKSHCCVQLSQSEYTIESQHFGFGWIHYQEYNWGHYHHWGGASNAGSYLLMGKNQEERVANSFIFTANDFGDQSILYNETKTSHMI